MLPESMETPKSSPKKFLTTSLPHPTRIGRRHCLPLVIVLLYSHRNIYPVKKPLQQIQFHHSDAVLIHRYISRNKPQTVVLRPKLRIKTSIKPLITRGSLLEISIQLRRQIRVEGTSPLAPAQSIENS